MKPARRRLLSTVIGMLLAGVLVALLWHTIFDARIPSCLSGLAGGMTALALWEFLRPDDQARQGQAPTCSSGASGKARVKSKALLPARLHQASALTRRSASSISLKTDSDTRK